MLRSSGGRTRPCLLPSPLMSQHGPLLTAAVLEIPGGARFLGVQTEVQREVRVPGEDRSPAAPSCPWTPPPLPRPRAPTPGALLFTYSF